MVLRQSRRVHRPYSLLPPSEPIERVKSVLSAAVWATSRPAIGKVIDRQFEDDGQVGTAKRWVPG